jgi:type I restriction enzyme S subunit
LCRFWQAFKWFKASCLKATITVLLEQKAIAQILTAFDDKIELLQAQNKTLETTAQTIFKEWFGKYQIGDELPEGWRV